MPRLGQILVSLGTTTENNVARALGVQGFAGGRLGTLLLERGSVGEDDLGEALAQQHGRPYVPWTVLGEVPPDVIASLPAKFAIRHAAIPFERGENYLKIALRDPGDLRILDELFFVTGRKILPAVAPEARIYNALEKYYGERRSPRYAILGEKLTRPTARRKSKEGPPPPPDFFPSGHRPAQPPKPHEVWGDSADSESAAPPIMQRWKIKDEPPTPWIQPGRTGRAEPPSPDEESITWEEAPPPEMWLPQSPAAAPPASAAPPSSPAPEPAPTQTVPEIFVAAPPSLFIEAPGGKPAPPAMPATPAPPAAIVAPPPAAPPPAAPPSADRPVAEPPRVPPSEADFPGVLAAGNRDEIAAAALAALSRRFERSAFFVVRPKQVVGHSAAGQGMDLEAFRAVKIPWTEPSVFLNVRLSRAFYLGALPPLPSHRFLVEALGGTPVECLVQPVMMREKPVAFLYAEFSADRGAAPMDLAYMRGLAAATARAFATAIRQKKKKEPV